MPDCLHMFKGYRVPPETVEKVRQAILDAPRRIDVLALRDIVTPALLAVQPWPRTTREDAAARAVESFLFDMVRAGQVKRHMNGWKFAHWSRVRKEQGEACR